MNKTNPTKYRSGQHPLTDGLLSYLELGKPQITFPVSLSALTGYLLYTGSFSPGWLTSMAGVFLMSFASSAINHVQDARLDKRMHRTRNRPLPSGRIAPWQALTTALVAALAGLALLIYGHDNTLPSWLSLLTMALYNLLYTPLKRITAFAVLPGALVGALPPIIGWTAAGGGLLHPHILLVGLFFFVGQIPHFWLILLKYDEDYKAAGIPTLQQQLSTPRVYALTLLWVTATTMAATMLVVAGVLQTPWLAVTTILLSLAILLSFRSWLQLNKPQDPHRAFRNINLFYLAMMLAIMTDALIR